MSFSASAADERVLDMQSTDDTLSVSLRDGREVYLCWRLGEDRIRFWHDLDGGFAGRQLL